MVGGYDPTPEYTDNNESYRDYDATLNALEDAGYISERADGEGLSLTSRIEGEQTSLFDDIKTVERRTTIDLTSAFGTSELRDVITTEGSGEVSPDPDNQTGEMRLTTGTTTGSSVILESAETGRYTPGHSAEIGIGIRDFDAGGGVTGDGFYRFGYYEPEGDGFAFGYDINPEDDTAELYTCILEDGTEVEKTYRRDWNGANVDAQLGRTTDLLTEGAIFQINYAWYGYGVIEYSVVSYDENNKQRTVILHRERRVGRTSIADPNSRITVEADNGSTTGDVDLRVGGRQFSILGELPVEQRITTHPTEAENISETGWTYLMAWRRTPGEPNSRFDVSSIDAIQNGAMEYAIFFVNPEFIGSVVENQVFTEPDGVKDAETLLQVDTAGNFIDPVDVSDANKIWSGLGPGSNGTSGSLDTENLNATLPQDGELVLAVQGVNNSTSDVNRAIMKMREDF